MDAAWRAESLRGGRSSQALAAVFCCAKNAAMEESKDLKPKSRWKRGAKFLFALLLLFLAADFIHAVYVQARISRWEATAERDEEGVLAGCKAYELPATNGSNNAAILFVHGINASPRHYDHLAPALNSHRNMCRVMRLPGFAEPIEAYRKTTAKGWITAVQNELKELRASHDRVGVVAHSLGGAVAVGALLEEPDSVDFAVLLAPAIEVSSARSPFFSTRTWHEFGVRTFWFTNTFYSPFTIDTRDPNVKDWPGRTPYTPVSVIEELYRLMDQNRPRAKEFRTPVLMVLSHTDRVVSTSAAKDYFRAIGSERKSLLMLKESGHAIPVDQEWEKVVKEIADFASPSTDTTDDS